jgi:prolyl-tRNA editing enzyme YbaK/EbsC (Cys-tRNA(Pro) deacylase)
MSEPLSKSALRVQEALATAGIPARIVELPASTRTAVDAAAAVGCTVGQIAKSLVFRRADTDEPVLVVASGTNRVDERLVTARLGSNIGKADADFVRRATGFAIGGVPPLGHVSRIRTLIDEDLLKFEVIWAAAGTPNAVFSTDPRQLVAGIRGEVMAVGVRKEKA